jgi:hypothetical protein
MKRKILSGQGKEWGNASKEVEQSFKGWLSCSSLTVEQFKSNLNNSPILIRIIDFDNGDKGIAVIAGKHFVAQPIVWQKGGAVTFEDFSVSAMLMLFYASTLVKNEAFDKEIQSFSRAFASLKK